VTSMFIETKALLLALEDADVYSPDNHDPLDDYLREQFLEGELRKLAEAADLLSRRAWRALQQKRASP
jgi:hypothetical protein